MDETRCRQERKIVPFDNRQREAMEVLREIAKNDTGRVFLGKHARQRMAEREIDTLSVYRALSIGEPRGEWLPGANAAETKLEVVYRPPGARQFVVVTVVLVDDRKAFVRTVFWADNN